MNIDFLRALAVALCTVFLGGAAQAQRAEEVNYAAMTVVVYNAAMPESKELAEYYAKARRIPAKQLVGLKCPNKETISRDEFTKTIEDPLRKAFSDNKWWTVGSAGQGKVVARTSRIKVVALMYGVPLRVAGTPLPPKKDPKTGKDVPQKHPLGSTDAAAVDSELAVLGQYLFQRKSGTKNPYFKRDLAFASAALPEVLMVGRIDGATAEMARGLIDMAIATEKEGLWGKAYLDLAKKTQGGYKQGEDWIKGSGEMFLKAGIPIVTDTHRPRFPPFYPMGDCALYFGWYITHADGPFTNPDWKFKPGAVACHIHSYSAATIKSPTKYWVGPLLHRGATAVLGNVYEPFLSLTTHFDLLNARLLKGYTFIESVSMATPAFSWMTVAIGDPLYRPFPRKTPEADKKADADYKAFKEAYVKWGDDHKMLMVNLERAAKNLKSGNLYEALGHLSAKYFPEDLARADAYFESAYQTFREAPNQLRVRLHQVDALRQASKKKEAIAKLEQTASEFTSIPENRAAQALLKQLNPPPPPPPPVGKK